MVSIMNLCRSLSHLAASHQGREEDPDLREEGQFRRTQSTHGFSGPVGRRKHSQKLTAAHSGSRTLRIAEDEPVAVYYEPGAFEELRKLEEAA